MIPLPGREGLLWLVTMPATTAFRMRCSYGFPDPSCKLPDDAAVGSGREKVTGDHHGRERTLDHVQRGEHPKGGEVGEVLRRDRHVDYRDRDDATLR